MSINTVIKEMMMMIIIITIITIDWCDYESIRPESQELGTPLDKGYFNNFMFC